MPLMPRLNCSVRHPMNKHKNIPIFVPHVGCPNDCVFCNQRKISGKIEFDPDAVPFEIERALATIPSGSDVEIAYFGGSFTGIEPSLMLKLLGIAAGYVEKGKVQSIRLSTRPDFIDEKILTILKEHYVKTVEIGFQSMDDGVLAASKRGHTTADSCNAACLIKEYGFELVGQMMTGLPSSDINKEIFTARELCRMGVDAARIYPTVVFCDTELCNMAKSGTYTSLTLEQSVNSAYEAYKIFYDNGVEVIRCGLCAADNLFEEGTVCSDGYHEALGEMVESRIMYDNIIRAVGDNPPPQISVSVAEGMTSRAVGHKKSNKIKLYENFGIKRLKVIESRELCGFEVRIN